MPLALLPCVLGRLAGIGRAKGTRTPRQAGPQTSAHPGRAPRHFVPCLRLQGVSARRLSLEPGLSVRPQVAAKLNGRPSSALLWADGLQGYLPLSDNGRAQCLGHGNPRCCHTTTGHAVVSRDLGPALCEAPGHELTKTVPAHDRATVAGVALRCGHWVGLR